MKPSTEEHNRQVDEWARLKAEMELTPKEIEGLNLMIEIVKQVGNQSAAILLEDVGLNSNSVARVQKAAFLGFAHWVNLFLERGE